MPDSAQSLRALRFGVFEVDFRAGELRKQGLRIRVQEKPLQVLEMLLERPGDVVTREELFQKLWPDVHVDPESNLNAAVNKLREALSDSADTPRFVETLPRRGYRFIAPVAYPDQGAVSKAEVGAEPTLPPPPPSRLWLVLLGVVASAALLVALNVGGTRSWLAGRFRPGLINSLAVLPFENLPGDPEQEYFADGMHEALIAELAQIHALRVISRTTMIQYRKTQKRVPEIAQELSVDGVVEGVVQREGDRVRITVQLIHGPTDRHLLARTHERDLRGALALQREVARTIAQEIRVTLTPRERERLASAGQVNPEAHQAYFKGRFFWNRRTEEGIKKSIEYFNLAIEKEPTYAPAHAGLADSYNLMGTYYLPPNEAYPKARAAALTALKLDEALAEAHASLADVKLLYEWDWPAAENEYKRAIELNPNYATARQWYATYLAMSGRHDQAMREVQQAQQLDPLSPAINAEVGLQLYYARRYDEAIEQCQKTLEMDPNFPFAHAWLGLIYLEKGVSEKAVEEFQTVTRLLPGNPFPVAMLGYTYAQSGRHAQARKALQELEQMRKGGKYVSSTYFALIYVGLGDRKRAFDWTYKACEERSGWLTRLKLLPFLESFRSDPRYRDLAQRVRLPE